MDLLHGLDEIDWSGLEHAYGEAKDVPDCLHGLLSRRKEAREEARWRLYGNVYHQGSRYSASAPAARFLLRLLDPSVRERDQILVLLTHLVAGQRTVGGVSGMGDGERLWRYGPPQPWPTLAEQAEAPLSQWAEEIAHWQEVWEEVDAQLGAVLSLLEDADPKVRVAAAHLLSCFARRTERVRPALVARFGVESDPRVLTALVYADALLDGPSPLRSPLHAHPLVRLFQAVAAVEAGEGGMEALLVLVEGISAPDAFGPWAELPFVEDLAAGIGQVVARLPPELRMGAWGALLGALQRTVGFSVIPLVDTLLELAFPKGVVPWDTLSEPQRALFAALLAHPDVWQIGNLSAIFQGYEIPWSQEELAGRLGVQASARSARSGTAARMYLEHLGMPDKAKELALEGLEKSPADAELLSILAEAEQELGNVEGAIAAWRVALKARPADVRGLFHLGVLLAEEDPAAALVCFEAAAALEGPMALLAAANVGVVLALMGRREEALARLGALVAENPTFAFGWYVLGLEQVKTGDYAASVFSITQHLALEPDNAKAYYTRACAYALQGERDARDSALSDVAMALELDPSLAAAMRDDDDLLSLRGDPIFSGLLAGAAHDPAEA